MSDEDEENTCLMVRAFHIEGGSIGDPSLPPTSGDEYLRRVQEEYRKCPKVVVADIDTTRFLANRTVRIDSTGHWEPAPSGFAPSPQWQKKQVACFSEVRKKLANHRMVVKKADVKLPKIDDDAGWCKFCFGGNGVEGSTPLLSLVCSMSQPILEQVLGYHVSWMEVTGFTSQQGRWFYSLLACLEKPLTPETCSTLRSLARACATLRLKLSSNEDPRLSPLNLLITLVANYFDQKDLAE